MNKQVLRQARERGPRSGRFLRRTAPLAAVVLGWAALAGPASAAVSGTHAIGALASTSGIELSGYTPGESLTIDALRGGATIGTATGTADAAGALDVNGGTATCWTTTTPEILSGDTISVSGAGFTDTMVVQNMTVGRAVQTAPGTVVVRGTASDPLGAALPLAGVASRVIVTSQDPFDKNGRKDLRAGADDTDGTLTYDAAGSVNWTATFSGLNAHDVSLALNAVELRGIYANAAESETTIAQAPGTPGPVAPCTAPLGTAPAPTPTPPATAPAASLSTASLSYADQEVGTTSAAQTVTLTNSGSANLVVSATALAGTNPGDYGIGANTCAGATVAPGASCTVDVSFAPTATGARSASLSFTDNAAGSPQSVSLSGNGTAPAATTPTTKPKPTPPSKPAPKPKPTPGPKTK